MLCDPGSELRLLIGGRDKRRAKKIYGMEKKRKERKKEKERKCAGTWYQVFIIRN